MHIRIMPKQEKPYRRLAKISESQPEFYQENVQGTLVGFFTPELFQGVAAAGFHLHFIDDTRKFGGHVMDFELADGTVESNRGCVTYKNERAYEKKCDLLFLTLFYCFRMNRNGGRRKNQIFQLF